LATLRVGRREQASARDPSGVRNVVVVAECSDGTVVALAEQGAVDLSHTGDRRDRRGAQPSSVQFRLVAVLEQAEQAELLGSATAIARSRLSPAIAVVCTAGRRELPPRPQAASSS
jgi:hypothetical protein